MKQATLDGRPTRIHAQCGKPMRFLDVYGDKLKKIIESYFCDNCIMGETIKIK